MRPPCRPPRTWKSARRRSTKTCAICSLSFALGKLSDADYQKTKVDLQRELARVLAEIDATPAPAARQSRARQQAAPSQGIE